MEWSVTKMHRARRISWLVVLVLVGACNRAEQKPPAPPPPPQQREKAVPRVVPPTPTTTPTPPGKTEADRQAQSEMANMDGVNLDLSEEEQKQWEQEQADLEKREAEHRQQRIAALGSPLVDELAALKKLDPVFPVWIDPLKKQVIMVGEVAQQRVPLEMFACLRGTKEHESVVVVDTKASIVHAGLLAVGAQPGRPVQFMPKYRPAEGAEIEITVVWKDQQGKLHRAPAQDWIRDVKTGKAMQGDWVFAGSGFWTDEKTGQKYYQAEGGDFICVSNFPSAMLDVPVESSQSNDALLFEAFTEHIPPLGTPVTIILAPRAGGGRREAGGGSKSEAPAK